MKKDLGKKVTAGLFWTFGERILAQGVSFIVSVILARILMPEEYGIISMVLVFINIANVFVSNGLGEALIQKKDATEEDFSTIFCCSFILSILLYGLLFLAAPWISRFYSSEVLKSVIRVLALKLPLASINSIQRAYVSKHLQFKKFFFSTLGGTVFSGIVGVALALRGCGVWALVVQYLVNSTVDTIILLLTVAWKPSFVFKPESARSLLAFGIRMMLSSLINTVYSEMQSLFIGKVYTAGDLAYYKRGNQFPSLLSVNICTAVSTVLFPAIANNSASITEVKSMTRKTMQMTAYIITPLMVGLIAVANPLVCLLLTEKWIPCVPYMQLLSLAYLLQPIQTANCQAIKAIGRSDVYLTTEIIKKVFGIAFLGYSLHRGTMAITIAFVLSVMISAIITMIPNIWLLDYHLKEQVIDLLPSFLTSMAMFVCIYPISKVQIPSVFVILIQIIVAVFVYVGISALTKNKALRYLIDRFSK